MTWPDGTFYDGRWLNGMRDGVGQYNQANGFIYKGQWMQDMKHG